MLGLEIRRITEQKTPSHDRQLRRKDAFAMFDQNQFGLPQGKKAAVNIDGWHFNFTLKHMIN
ncbi:hypothetical protein HL653_13310 [Sphingomonas sp. AP4-R1]|uniref:hypothetical protein n=1 Tax=Sphingomonas sp. AP4-R1 TaxID=2735134 RepID=UPI001493A3A4|nr:hypothetical protein [Sphingomonas sp. AP4-R1]QJU58610.1 hypothetical protein HL653_13310 [Sphingomonas sp. AP4-R1]